VIDKNVYVKYMVSSNEVWVRVDLEERFIRMGEEVSGGV